jgi:hypothetical protein
MENTSKIIDRIKKLLALSTSSNANEAAAAAGKAAQMMADYELEEADLRVESGASNSDPIDNIFWDGVNGQRVITWKSNILMGLIKAFHCHGWYTYVIEGEYPNRTKHNRFKVVGRRANVQTANYMYLYLEKEIERLANNAWLNFNAFSPVEANRIHGKHYKNSFFLGASNEIYRRLIEQVAAEKVESVTDSKAMVLVRQDHKEVEKYFNQIKPALKNVAQSKSYINRDAHTQGKEAGSKINLGGAKPSLGAAPRQLTA